MVSDINSLASWATDGYAKNQVPRKDEYEIPGTEKSSRVIKPMLLSSQLAQGSCRCAPVQNHGPLSFSAPQAVIRRFRLFLLLCSYHCLTAASNRYRSIWTLLAQNPGPFHWGWCFGYHERLLHQEVM